MTYRATVPAAWVVLLMLVVELASEVAARFDLVGWCAVALTAQMVADRAAQVVFRVVVVRHGVVLEVIVTLSLLSECQ